MASRCVMIRILALPQVPPCARDYRGRLEQAALRDRKPVEAVVLLFGGDAPLRETVGYVLRQLVKWPLEPLRCNLSHPRVEVCADAVEVDAENQPLKRGWLAC